MNENTSQTLVIENLTSVTSKLKQRVSDLKDSIKELDQFFSSSDYICPHCNKNSMKITKSSASADTPEKNRIEFMCKNCGFEEVISYHE